MLVNLLSSDAQHLFEITSPPEIRNIDSGTRIYLCMAFYMTKGCALACLHRTFVFLLSQAVAGPCSVRSANQTKMRGSLAS